MTIRLRLLFVFVLALVLSSATFARTSSTTTKSKPGGHVTESARAQKRIARRATSARPVNAASPKKPAPKPPPQEHQRKATAQRH